MSPDALPRNTTTWPERVDELARAHPDVEAVVDLAAGRQALSWGELSRRSCGMARFFLDCGAIGGSTVVVQLRNGLAHVVATIAAWRLGATVVPMSPDLPEVEADRILRLAHPSLVVDEDFGAGFPSLSFRLSDEDRSGLPAGAVADPAWMIGSGGSTGTPKLIAPAVRSEIQPEKPGWLMGRQLRFANSADHRHPSNLICAPLYHTHAFSLLYHTLLEDYRIVMVRGFDAERVLDVIEDEQISFVGLVPTMLVRLLRSPTIRSRDFSSIEYVLQGAAACPEWVIRAWIDLVGAERFLMGYGQSEGIGSAMIRGDEWIDHPGSVGRPAGCDLRVVDDDGNDVAPGEVGELFFRRPESSTTFRYVGGAEPKVLPGGYLSTGDLGRLDGDGYLFVVDRRVDMIVTGGQNVYVSEVEAALLESPAVEDVAVVGLADPEWGRRVHAIVVLRDPKVNTTFEELRSWCKQRLAPYKVPKTLEFVQDIERTPAGKVNRSALAAARDRRDL
jgi:bile acid-coenzyme A ligase